MEKNYSPRKVSAITLATASAHSPYFKIGYDSYIKGKPFDYSIENMSDAVCYERGRQFAVWCIKNKQPRAVWRKDGPAKTLIDRLVFPIRIREVI